MFFKLLLNAIPRPLLIRLGSFVSPFMAFYLKGDRYTDPIDGKSFRRFLPYGYRVQRANALSPSTLSLERHRLLWLYLKNETSFFTERKKILHMAPEQCFLNRFEKLHHTYITADLYSPIAKVKADITHLPFEDHSFDVVFCNHVLEHIKDDTKAMQELYRVMKKGGMGIFQVPLNLNCAKTFEDASITNRKQRTRIFGQYDHVRIYGRDYFDKLKDVGFKVKKVDYSKKISPQLFSRYRLMNGEILPVVFKN